MTEVIDLLAALRAGTRRGAGQEVDLDRPAPSTRGTGEGSGSVGHAQAPIVETQAARWARVRKIKARLAGGTHTTADVEWARQACRTPGLLTRGEPFDCDCDKAPVRYLGVEIASSACELDGVCWQLERQASAARRAKPPLYVLRRANGRPNYASASEQERFLRESGALAAAAGGKKPVDWPKREEWPVPWETWIEAQNDARRVDPNAGREPLPIEKLADVTLDSSSPHPWRRWDGDRSRVRECDGCGDTAGYSVGGRHYCRDCAPAAQEALKHGLPLPGAETIEEEEVAA